MNSLVLIADIISSRKSYERSELQNNLKFILEELNNKNENIISPYTITLGDEFQAVFAKADALFCDVIEIMAKLHPTKVRFSFGLGEITTNIIRESAIGMDGPPFYAARDGLNTLKETSCLISFTGLHGRDEKLINQTLCLFSIESSKWKASRLKTFSLYLAGKSVKEISEELALTDKAIYKTIKAGLLELFQEQFLEIEKVINEEIS
jgi:hypothetical protein